MDSLNLADYGFKMDFIENGRPAYHPADLLKLFIYSYLNSMRSSRVLEKECNRNIELIWLLKGLVPESVVDLYNSERPHMSINNFTPNTIHHSKTKIKTERLWKNYYRKQNTSVNPIQD